eukprot:TRINITY_DN94089_c0_g1_i1.p1 TRINITY_DN94089_c0_g1~~TRINITY_DN94089_c0_g1_i1.p1  ORF type:complete len:509 (+),score=87.91 TRINITY_DN94089_c0_g1_i1:42-1568(+)
MSATQMIASTSSSLAEVAQDPSKRRYCYGGGGVLLICVGLFHTFLLWQLTPVYTATECGHQEAELDNFNLGAESIHVDMQISVSCTNPNPYKINILSSKPGRVFVGVGDRKQVGKLAVIPGSFLQEEGTGKVRVKVSVDISGEQSNLLLPHFLSDAAVNILMELQFNVGVYVSFGLGSWGVVAPFQKACGLKMMGLLVNQYVAASDGSKNHGRLGPLVCRKSFEGIDQYIPAIGDKSDTPEDGNMGFSAAQVAPTEVEAGELAKNLSLGGIILLAFFSGAVLLYSAISGEAIPFPTLPSLPTISTLSSLYPAGTPNGKLPEPLQLLTAKEEGEDEDAYGDGSYSRPGFQRNIGSPTRASQAVFRAAGMYEDARGLSNDTGDSLSMPATIPAKRTADETSRLVAVGRQESSTTSAGGVTPERPRRQRPPRGKSPDDGAPLLTAASARSKDVARSNSPGARSRSDSRRRSSQAYDPEKARGRSATPPAPVKEDADEPSASASRADSRALE